MLARRIHLPRVCHHRLLPQLLRFFLEHLGVAEDRVERRAQFVRHAADEGALVPGRVFQLAARGLNLLEEAGVLDGDDGLGREGLHEGHLRVGEAPLVVSDGRPHPSSDSPDTASRSDPPGTHAACVPSPLATASGAEVLALADQQGFPSLPLRPMLLTVPAGATAWRDFVASASGTTLYVARRHLNARVEPTLPDSARVCDGTEM